MMGRDCTCATVELGKHTAGGGSMTVSVARKLHGHARRAGAGV